VSAFEPLVAIDLEPVDWHAIHSGPFPAPSEARLVTAQTDTVLARAFLHANALSPHSLKSTAKDLGRFLLWCQTQDKMLTQLRIEDLLAYRAFLSDPQPASHWISATKWPRADSRWRPFSGPLAPVSAAHAFRVAKALLEFATDTGYLPRNAGALVKNLKAPRPARVSRFLSDRAICHVQLTLAALPTATRSARQAQARGRFLFEAYLTTGARLSEITQATMGAIYAETDGRWWLDVLGKGSKPRRLPVSLPLLDTFRRYRAQYGLVPETTRDDPAPLILATRGTEQVGVTDEAVSNAIKRLFLAAAGSAHACGEADCATALRKASTHWLRHTMLTNQANNNVSLKALQDTAGHANIATTALYLHKSDQERHDEIMTSLEKAAAHSAS
jgi:integrase/recombinase XerD